MKIFRTIIFTISWDILIFYQIFISPQVKRYAIIIYKIAMCELPNKLLIDLRLRILGNYEVSGKFLNFIE